ncbi:hypothetical protein [Streptomyces sp. Qhu_M48]|uniref:hypothetical protein n=1 Tax=Streptomyces sp. Qhu_M48 TaxID=3435889 RepID=UPI003F4F6AE1
MTARTAPTPPAADDPAFRAWLRTLADDLDLDLDRVDNSGAPGRLAFFRDTFSYNGAVPAPYFVPLLAEHRRIHAERVVTALLVGVYGDTGRTLDVPVHYEWPGEQEPAGRLTVGHETVHGIDPADIALEAAEGVQCLLADRDRLVWPLCPDHRVGVHATPTPTGPAWVCAAGAHVVDRLPD